jgi:hypothetical protein
VRFRLSSGTLRELVVVAVGFGVAVGVEVEVEFDVMGAVGIIMAAMSDWRGGGGPRRRRAFGRKSIKQCDCSLPADVKRRAS